MGGGEAYTNSEVQLPRFESEPSQLLLLKSWTSYLACVSPFSHMWNEGNNRAYFTMLV